MKKVGRNDIETIECIKDSVVKMSTGHNDQFGNGSYSRSEDFLAIKGQRYIPRKDFRYRIKPRCSGDWCAASYNEEDFVIVEQ